MRLKAEAVVLSPFKAIASPLILRGWSPIKSKENSFAFRGLLQGLAAEPEPPQSPKKNEMLFGAIGRFGTQPPFGRERISSEVSLTTFLVSSKDDRADEKEEPVQFMESSKMREMHEARRLWQKNHSDNSPFPAHKQLLTKILHDSPSIQKTIIEAVKD